MAITVRPPAPRFTRAQLLVDIRAAAPAAITAAEAARDVRRARYIRHLVKGLPNTPNTHLVRNLEFIRRGQVG